MTQPNPRQRILREKKRNRKENASPEWPRALKNGFLTGRVPSLEKIVGVAAPTWEMSCCGLGEAMIPVCGNHSDHLFG